MEVADCVLRLMEDTHESLLSLVNIIPALMLQLYQPSLARVLPHVFTTQLERSSS